MAVANSAVVKLFSDRLIERLMVPTYLRNLVVDRTAELGGRESMELTDLKRSVTLNTRTSNNADFGTRQDADAASVTLTTDKHYDFNLGVGWLDDMETVGDLMAAAERWGTDRIEQQVQTDLQATLVAATPQSTTDLAIKVDNNSGNNTLLKDEGAVKILDWLVFTIAEAQARGQSNFAFATAPKVHAAMLRYLRDKGTNFPGASIARDALTGMELPMIHGSNVYPIPVVAGRSTAAGNDQFKSHLLDPTESAHFAIQIQRTRVIPDPDGPRDLFQGLLKWGSVAPARDNNKVETMYRLQMDFTT